MMNSNWLLPRIGAWLGENKYFSLLSPISPSGSAALAKPFNIRRPPGQGERSMQDPQSQVFPTNQESFLSLPNCSLLRIPFPTGRTSAANPPKWGGPEHTQSSKNQTSKNVFFSGKSIPSFSLYQFAIKES